MIVYGLSLIAYCLRHIACGISFTAYAYIIKTPARKYTFRKVIRTGFRATRKTPIRYLFTDIPWVTLLAGWLVVRSSVDGYVLESPISNVSDWTGGLVPFLLKPFIRFDIDPVLARENNIGRVANIRSPLLIIAGERDEITPVRMVETLYEASGSASRQKIRIPEDGHNDLPVYEEYAEALHRLRL